MKYGIIAAGEGSRLAAEGIVEPKPLIEIGGEKLIDRLVRIFMENHAEEISIVCNEQMKLVGNHIASVIKPMLSRHDIGLNIVVKSTPSSMHSFAEIARFMGNCTSLDKADISMQSGGGHSLSTVSTPFVVTTVDTIFSERVFSEYIKAFSQLAGSDAADGLMGVTQFVDDEKPLYVGVGEDKAITGFFDEANGKYISAGIYGLTSRSIATLDSCLARGERRMRNFQRALVSDGLRLKAFDMGKVLDIDHAQDIAKADTMIVRDL